MEEAAPGASLELCFTSEVDEALKGLRAFMFEHVYKGDICALERERAAFHHRNNIAPSDNFIQNLLRYITSRHDYHQISFILLIILGQARQRDVAGKGNDSGAASQTGAAQALFKNK